MQVYGILSDEARKARFITTGEIVPEVLTLTIPTADLSPETRTTLAGLVNFDGEYLTKLTIPPSTHYSHEAPRSLSITGDRAWPLPTYPETAADWEAIIAQYAAAVAAYRQQQQEAEQARRAQNQADFDDWRTRLVTAPVTSGTRWKHFYSNTADYLIGLPEARAEWAAYQERVRVYDARQSALKAQEEAAKEAAKEASEAEKSAWITAHGSAHLQRAFAAGYDCQRKYVTERAEMEYPGYVVDFGSNAVWRSRSCPSEAALDEALRVDGEVVWFFTPPRTGNADDDDFDYTAVEAVIVKLLDRYDLVKTF